MPDTLIAPTPAPLVEYNVSEAQIEAIRVKCSTLTTDTPQGYEEVRVAIATLRETRGSIENRRVELKADALAFGRLVDSEAKRFTGLLLEIEEPLKVKKAAVDDEKARIKAEAEALKLRALEAEIAANRARQEADLKAVRDAEEARLAKERAELEAERRQMAEERLKADEAAKAVRDAEERTLKAEHERVEAAQQAEREALDKERRAVAAEREKAERIEFERQARIKAEKDAVAKAERDRLDAAERQARLDALRPDVEKVAAFAETIRALVPPKPRTKEAKIVIATAVSAMNCVAIGLEATVREWKGAA